MSSTQAPPKDLTGINLLKVGGTIIKVRLDPERPTAGSIIFMRNYPRVFDAVLARLNHSPVVKSIEPRAGQIDWVLAVAEGQPMSRGVRRSLRRKEQPAPPSGTVATRQHLISLMQAVKQIALRAAARAYLHGLPAAEVDALRSKRAR